MMLVTVSLVVISQLLQKRATILPERTDAV